MKPRLEVNKNCIDKTIHYTAENNHIMVSPPTGEDYWMFRVKLYKDQAVLGFPKYGLIGVGMAQEEEGNVNKPLEKDSSPEANANMIYSHIKCNKKYKSITMQMIKDAIILIGNGAAKYCNKGGKSL